MIPRSRRPPEPDTPKPLETRAIKLRTIDFHYGPGDVYTVYLRDGDAIHYLPNGSACWCVNYTDKSTEIIYHTSAVRAVVEGERVVQMPIEAFEPN